MSRPELGVPQALRQQLLPCKGVLVAVSGGVDSMVLLHAVHALRRLYDSNLAEQRKQNAALKQEMVVEVAHVDHRVRPTSARDAELVAKFSAKLGVELHATELEAPPKGANFEAWARSRRYQWFRHVRRTRGLEWILTAHQANDVAETLLMRLLQNKELRNIERIDPARKVLRPLLDVSRAQIELYAEQHHIPFAVDETNMDTAYTRNRVRHRLMPFLKEHFGGHVVRTLSERGIALAEDHDRLAALTDPAFSRLRRYAFGSRAWTRAARAELSSMHEGLQWRFIERLFQQRLGYNLGRRRAKQLLKVIRGEAEAIELPGSISVCRRAGGIALRGTRV